MANIKEIQLRIRSIQDTMKITNAMYLISSSKLKKAKQALEQTLPYFTLQQSTIAAVLANSQGVEHAFFDKRENVAEKKRGYIVITGDKGLCGSYNHNAIRLCQEQLNKHKGSTLFLIGQVGRMYFANRNVTIDGEFLYTAQKPNLHRARNITDSLVNLFLSRALDEVYLIYTHSISQMQSEPRLLKLLPLEARNFEKAVGDRYNRAMVFSPSPEAVMDAIVPNYVKGVIFGALIESFSSEQNARMVAMDGATKSAKQMLADLSLIYNRARQAAITQEITEIIGGSQ